MRFSILLLLLFTVNVSVCIAQSIAINTDGSPPDASAILDLKSSTKGLLIPRMTTAEKEAIENPVQGLVVFDTETNSFWFHNGVGWIEVATGGATNFWSLNGTHVFNTNSGYVGIGVNDPNGMLDVGRGIAVGGTAVFRGTTHASHFNYSTNEDTYIRGGKGSSSVIVNDAFYISRSGSSYLTGSVPRLQLYQNGVYSGAMEGTGVNMEINAYRPNDALSTPGNLLLQVPFSNQFINYYAGNVGIGTSAPDYKLSISSGAVQGNNNTHVLKLSGRNPVLSFTNENNASYGYIKLWTNAPYAPYTNGLVIGAVPGYPIFFSTNNYGVTMTVADNGNVGIGTTTPTYKLAVNGNIRSKEVVVESSGWPDYVFDKNYQRPSLLQLEKFIQQNKHLPNIPSAKEVEEKGLHLGDIQKRMMEKIEELTLYIIELKKEIDELKSPKDQMK